MASVPLLTEAGIQAVMAEAPGEAFTSACREAGVEVLSPDAFAFVDTGSIRGAPSGKPVAFTGGSWPGLAQFDGVSGASSGPWIDANLHWITWLRALYPKRPPIIAYVPKNDATSVPYDSLETALAEAWVMGGNYLLAVPPTFCDGLLKGDDQARQAWARLGRTSRFLREHAVLFNQPVSPNLTVLVEGGETTAEIANLLYRRSLSPALAPAADPPAPDPRLMVLLAVELEPPAAAVCRRILAHAESGATVVVNGAWWKGAAGLKKLRSDPDREIYALGRGRVAAYREAIGDPGEFAYDVIDLVGQERRAARVWNAAGAIAVAAGKGLLYVVNYGWRSQRGALVRVHGSYRGATLLRPEAPPARLQPVRRGAGMEVEIPEMQRVAVLVFE